MTAASGGSRGERRGAGARRRASGLLAALVLVGATGTPSLAQNGGLIALPHVTARENLLKNGGFESVDDGAPAGWRLAPDRERWTASEGARTGRVGLRLAGAAAAPAIPAAEQVVVLEPGYYAIGGWVKAEALGAQNRAGVRMCLDGRPRLNWWHCTSVVRGTSDWRRIGRAFIPVEHAGAYRVTVGAHGRPDGTAWFDDVALQRLDGPPLDAFLLYPNYRGMLFDDRAQTVRVALSMPASTAPRDARIRLELVDEASGQVKERREYAGAEASRGKDAPLVGELDAVPVAHGEYLVRATLLDGERDVYRHPEYRIVKAPPAARETLRTWYDERNIVHLDGKPAFVLGLYTTSGYSTQRAAYAMGTNGWGTDRMSQAPVNMLINYWLGAAPIPALLTYLDDLRARGIRYLQTVNFYHEDDPQYPKLPYPAARDGELALDRWVGKTLGRHPGLAGFYTADERTAEMVPKVFRQHRELRRAAPGTVNFAVLGDGWQHQAPLWRDAVDVLGLDPYPITRPAGANHLAMVGDWTRLGQDAVMRSRPVWTVIQYFPLTTAGGWPSQSDLRAMSWMAIIEGARGLFYWSYGARGLAWVKDPAEREQRWQDLVTVTREIKALEPVLLLPDAAVTREGARGAVRTLGKRSPDGTRYLFAYNGTNARVPAVFTLTEPARDITPLDPASAPPAVDGLRLSDTFAPYEVKRYRIR